VTDKQLHILLGGLLDELADAIEAVAVDIETHGIDREQQRFLIDDDGAPAHGLAAVGAALRNQFQYVDDPDGRFLALAALDALHERWENRFSALVDGVSPD